MVVQLVLMRHGEAEAHSARDSDRSLTPAGIEEVQAAANSLKSQGQEIGRLLTSPYARARQTAEIVRTSLGTPPAVECDAVVPGGDPKTAFETIVSLLDAEARGMVVMHQPIISRLIHLLSGEQISMGTARIVIMEAPVAAVGSFEVKCVI
jgi:phosphohistidine phosphatase